MNKIFTRDILCCVCVYKLTGDFSLSRWILLTRVAKPKEQIVSHKSSSLGLTWTNINVFESDPVITSAKLSKIIGSYSW